MSDQATMKQDGVTLSVAEATAFAERALARIGFSPEESQVIAGHLIDSELCGYPAIGLSRILTVAQHPRMKEPRTAPRVVHETPLSALIDGGNTVGLYAVQRAAQVAIDKARASRVALVGMHNSYLSGRNAYYVEMIARAGFVAIHTACSRPVVAPLGGRAPAFGTNPIAFALPAEPDPLILDMGTASLNHGDVILAARLHRLLPEGTAIDADGESTRDPAAALAGAILPFGGHKGHGLSFAIQALGLLAGAALPRGQVQDFAFLFVVFDPGLLVEPDQLRGDLAELVGRVTATPRQPGVDEILVPSQRAWRERERGRKQGIALDRRLYDAIGAL